MTLPFDSPEPTAAAIPRDGKKRPLVLLPDGSKQTAYTRATTYIACLEDQYAVHLWQQRMVAVGLADRPDLLVSVAANRNNRTELNSIVDAAREAAKANAAARTGTALHQLADQWDRGERPLIPPAYQADMDAYREATKGFQHVHIEQFCVQDKLKVGGTPDRVVGHDGAYYIADIKTGSIEYSHLTFAMQFALYANSVPYYHTTQTRGSWPDGLSTTKAILIHLPQGEGTADLYWVDIAAGWDAVTIATAVRAWRNRKGLVVPFSEGGPPTTRQHVLRYGNPDMNTLRQLIRTERTADSVRQFYRDAVAAGIDGASILDECRRRVQVLSEFPEV